MEEMIAQINSLLIQAVEADETHRHEYAANMLQAAANMLQEEIVRQHRRAAAWQEYLDAK